VRQRPKGPIDPTVGARVRELRTSRGMTQADLAGSDFTTGFISLLETGRTRASLRAAEIIAARLGTTAPELLVSGARDSREMELLVVRAEQQLAAGAPATTLELVDRVSRESTGLLRARALRAKGRALRDLGKPREALAVLEEAGRAFDALGQRDLAVRTLFDRAVAHAHADEPGNALTLALECETAMRLSGLVDRTLELQLRSFLAATFARAGDNESADAQAAKALEMSSAVVDREAIGTLYSTLAVTRHRQGQLDDALRYARKSLTVFEDLGRDRALGQMWHNIGSIQLSRGDYAGAEKAITAAERIAADAKIPALAARVLSLRAELAAAQRRWKQADAFARDAEAHPSASAQTKGKALLVQARALAAGRAPLRSVRERIDRAMAALAKEPASARAEVADTYARLLADRGEWKPAYEVASSAIELLRPQLR
jgi:tetratricopeptide (TPR) repeat protein